MPGPRQSLEVLEGKGRKHLSRSERAQRAAGEVRPAPPKQLRAPEYLTAELKEQFRALARQLKDARVYLVTLSDAQWEDPLYGQMIFFVPEDASGGAVLALYEGEPDSSTPSAVHQIPLELPWGAVGTV